MAEMEPSQEQALHERLEKEAAEIVREFEGRVLPEVVHRTLFEFASRFADVPSQGLRAAVRRHRCARDAAPRGVTLLTGYSRGACITRPPNPGVPSP